ncbi:MAG: DNA-directed RNA polymerase subunit delta [Firmicutes bacterium]|nr:DNA-directed RNA polymerase subunit delta [Candidatus Alectryobacillus merdavium]
MGGNITLIDETYNYLLNSKEKKSFSEIWNHLCNDTNLVAEEKKSDATYKSKFYTALTLDSRFVFLSGNTWDLRDRQTFDVVKNIMNLEMAYSDTDVDPNEDKDDDEDYNSSSEIVDL